MANPSKSKGDRAELEAVRVLTEMLPDYALPKAKRMLGAGRKEDVGDLFVFPDVAVQVKNFKMASLGAAIHSAATGAEEQADNGDLDYALGMVKVPGAREGTVKWLAVVSAEEAQRLELNPVVVFPLVSKLVKWVRDDQGPEGYRVWPKTKRIASFTSSRDPQVRPCVMPLEAWTKVYSERSLTLAEQEVTTMGASMHLGRCDDRVGA